jgi:hypothetical protein
MEVHGQHGALTPASFAVLQGIEAKRNDACLVHLLAIALLRSRVDTL